VQRRSVDGAHTVGYTARCARATAAAAAAAAGR